ncbi:MAG: septal ring lytic transglycosylase RlpA family protein, partial [Pseudoxanthomonas suwonensis]|nr:septal ring lytic transglycosylase RlpA family protein [Pseudoxanthomonas suwonensis]
MTRLPALAALSLALAACASAPKQAREPESAPAASAATAPAAAAAAPSRSRTVSPYAPAREDPNTRGHYVAGGLYRPGVADTVPDYIPNVDAIPEPDVVHEPRSRVGNRSPYTVLGRQYHVMDDHAGFVETGTASYYGNKFHGRRTSNQEVYDMYAFTAAHKSLPLPSFARVTNLDNGRSVVVRVNDRGPFHEGRVIDLSYAAAVKLGYRDRGTARVEVRALLPGEDAVHRPAGTRVAQAAAPANPAAVAPTAIAPASGIDQLVAMLPAADGAGARAGASRLRGDRRARATSAAGTTAASVVVAPIMLAPTTTSSTLGAPPSAVPATDAVVADVGPAAAAASVPAAAPVTPNPAGERFTVFQNGRALSADEFDAWMAQRQLRVATGRATRIAPVSAASAPAATASTVAPSAATNAAT